MKLVEEECAADYWSLIQNQLTNQNTPEPIVSLFDPSDPIPTDTVLLEGLKELRKDKLFLKKDIKEHDLLFWSCYSQAKMRCEYLAEWDPDCLMTSTHENLPLSHTTIDNCKDITSFNTFLTTSLKHHPQHLGLLFQKDSSGKRYMKEPLRNMEMSKHSMSLKSVFPKTLLYQS